MNQKSKWLAVVIMIIGTMMLLNDNINFLTAAALILLTVGMLQVRNGDTRKGHRYLGIGAALLLLDNLMIVFLIVLASLAYFYSKNKKIHLDEGVMKKQNFMARYYWDQSSWTLRSMSLWHAIGEVNADLSLSIPEEKQTIVLLQGVMGNVRLTLPEDYGVEIEASVLFGRINLLGEQDSGMMNKLVWRTPGYESSEHKAKFVISYIVGDLSISNP
ncbi:cell wall-active antibiotics response protein LiaF [Paenibacillus sp. FSL R5-0623]|uniref:cell wall-active antibiotics response protein LiaF n=1 Tax=Paenibacillus TaxID=44249 RepID=UPI000B838130|nr:MULTISPECIES: cell wall-active antibiotics response protein LiaF [Paenibacillus]MBD8841410.1 cell wall-active antibiotics response protein [Paenibacillus sp. CFBP 13594]MBY0118625.1 cell wall-active antibiotics response protein [Paenibacillus xylanexedens]MDQ0660380.1 lia operon protein LiaF [Paenibacillus sp. W2I17]MDQ0724394.1 lia operon protein LiaF [Paenibacillus sp. W4I10]